MVLLRYYDGAMKQKKEVVTTSLRIPRALHKKLCIYKAKHQPHLSLNSLIIETLDDLVKKDSTGGDAA